MPEKNTELPKDREKDPGGDKQKEVTPQVSATAQLSNLPFAQLIGGPLTAAIDAQAQAAISSLNFIKGVGFDKDGNTVNVTFVYKKEDKEFILSVPVLAIVPIPFIRIADMTIDFKANISADTTQSEKTTTAVDTSISASVSGKYWMVSASLNASASSKKDSSSTKDSKYSVEYTMDVKVHAVQDDIPAGLSKVLNILDESIKSEPKQGQKQG